MLRNCKSIIAAMVCLSIGFCLPVRAYGVDPTTVINLWPNEPPGPKLNVGEEQDMTKPQDALIAGRRIIKLGNVKTPQVHVYLPSPEKRTGSSMVICPGGGFNILAWDLEGTEVAEWLTDKGVTAIVLKYRVPTQSQTPRWKAPVQDAQRAISLVRSRAKEWGLDSDKVGILGFSAGGQTAVRVALIDQRQYDNVDAADALSCKPNAAVLIYSGGLATSDFSSLTSDLVVTKDSPRMFISHAFDDGTIVYSSSQLLMALKKAGVPSELHVYDAGGHGYGLRPVASLPVTSWTKPCEDWLQRAKWLK